MTAKSSSNNTYIITTHQGAGKAEGQASKCSLSTSFPHLSCVPQQVFKFGVAGVQRVVPSRAGTHTCKQSARSGAKPTMKRAHTSTCEADAR